MALSGTASAQLDLDGNGLSDVWETFYEVSELLPDHDLDNDGYSNFEESLSGSDPSDPLSYFGLDGYDFRWSERDVELTINIVEQNEYVIESSETLNEEGWEIDKRFLTNSSGSVTFWCPFKPDTIFERYFRVRQIIDADRDGLTAWEERTMGLDDHDPASSGAMGGGDLSWAVDRLLSGFEFPLSNGSVLRGFSRSRSEVSRFLNQATFGPTLDEIEALDSSEITFGEWLDAQMELPAFTIERAIDLELEAGAVENEVLFRRGWWRAAASGEDQLRQRVAFALSQILVISGQGSDLVRGSSLASGTYYDLLINGAFGNYADLLEDVTYNVGMGTYLGHLRNQKANLELGIYPDENYARELMQLFSIGLWELNRDGSQKLDQTGNPIPTYSNFHITELAKVMTGFGWGGTDSFAHYLYRPGLPMTIWSDQHDRGEKILVNNGYLPANLSPKEDVRRAIENLANHPNTGPFVGRLLIQRLVTSNPSPAYIKRVANAYYDNGSGEVGDLRSVIRAIFLDPEARLPVSRSHDDFGKMREPYVTLVHLVRAFEASNEHGSYPISTTTAMDSLGQLPLMSQTVFNFYSPNYTPGGELGERDLVAPEFEILTPLRSVGWANWLRFGIEQGLNRYEVSAESGEVLEYNLEEELSLLENFEELIDHLDLIFTYGSLTEGTKQIIRDATRADLNHIDLKRLQTAIYLVMTSPEYTILR
ncbi:DUF1800 domain-containing protein [Akkermansiaceae bacterium]|nr:DUF1800 domain-containing protein [Akkermansiaceae bacterium]